MSTSVYEKPSILTRITIGKALGLLIGFAGFLILPSLWPEYDPLFRWGILFWYATLGSVVGVFGVLNYHPVLQMPFPWWVRAPLLGGWFNLVLTFFAYDALAAAMVSMMGMELSPFWFVLEGAIVGLIIGGVATRFGGEGQETAEVLKPD